LVVKHCCGLLMIVVAVGSMSVLAGRGVVKRSFADFACEMVPG